MIKANRTATSKKKKTKRAAKGGLWRRRSGFREGLGAWYCRCQQTGRNGEIEVLGEGLMCSRQGED